MVIMATWKQQICYLLVYLFACLFELAPALIVDVCLLCVCDRSSPYQTYLFDICYYAMLFLALLVVCNLVLVSIHMLAGLQFCYIIHLFTYILHANCVECLETGKILPFFKNA
jgi:hypothetical protein